MRRLVAWGKLGSDLCAHGHPFMPSFTPHKWIYHLLLDLEDATLIVCKLVQPHLNELTTYQEGRTNTENK